MGRGKKVGIVFLGVLLGVFLCYFAFTKRATPARVNPPIPLPVESEIVEEWKAYSPQSERFQVSFPSFPQHAAQSIPMPEGNGVVRYDMYLAQARNGATYMINVIEYPSSFDTSDAETILSGVMKEMVAGNPGNTLVKNEKTSLFGNPALEFIIHNQESSIKTVTIQKDHFIFVLSAADSTERGAEQNFSKLIKSFKICE